ncbi:unnamed protein product [Angiostrongylus costaricensis]|uniref:DUF4372 domain-containing protein n=1 Tax=Angiostrongylus costaricensis TaxID=334426 RepID=A0A0R3PMK3_ANGCS|nr:unnamed protein product [Angiostrongylus costaricensis]
MRRLFRITGVTVMPNVEPTKGIDLYRSGFIWSILLLEHLVHSIKQAIHETTFQRRVPEMTLSDLIVFIRPKSVMYGTYQKHETRRQSANQQTDNVLLE